MTSIEQTEANFLANFKTNIAALPPKTFYAPELSKDILVNYLARTSGSNESQQFNNFDLSILFRDSVTDLDNMIEMSHTLNGWTIKGYLRYYDKETMTIALPVVLSTNRILEIQSEGKDNQYAIELAIIRYLALKQNPTNQINLAVIAIDRLFTNYKSMPTKMLNFIPIEDTYTDDEIEAMLLVRTTELQLALETKTPPSICSDLRWHRKHGKSINMSCTHYCSYNHICPHNKKKQYHKVSNPILF